ncbi:NYN domain-containing protein [Candidatus Similichlamydia epinepheli]|uniref:NYN domain-containing protein n=1 Tax=Candidatus Similichlamydia epinepheli TaxID=1903953 RepID=UPI000D3CA9D6|nr:NYN domain-containing protein [Candidatus Similichlamydia epinepheli]
MRYLIDGHNWFFATTSFSQGVFPKEHRLFLEKLKRLLSNVNGDCLIVFDGGKHSNQLLQSRINRIRIIYTGNQQSADEHILEILSFSSKDEPSILVSSDSDLAQAAKRLGAKTIKPHEFEAWILSKKRKEENKKHIKCDPLEQRYYINIFTKKLRKMREHEPE